MNASTYYELLGVVPDATAEEIRRAYVELAREHHPDHGGSGVRMLELNEAWAVLGDPVRRRAYDAAIDGRHSGEPVTDMRMPPWEDPDDFDDLADLGDPWPLAPPPARWMTMLPPLLFALSIVAGAVGVVFADSGVVAFSLVLFGLSLVAVAAVTLLTLKSSVRSRRR